MKVPSNLVTIGVIAAILILGALAIFLTVPRATTPLPTPNSPLVVASDTATRPVSTTPAATILPLTPGTPIPGALVRVWSSMCVEGVPYTLLSIPLDAQFALVQAEAQVPVTSVPITGGTPAPSAIPTYSTPSFVGGTAGPSPTATPQAANGTALVPATGNNKGTLGIVPTQNSCTALGQLNGLQLVMCTGPEGSLFYFYVREANAAQLYQGGLWDCTAASSTPATPSLVPTVSQTPQSTISPSAVPPTQPSSTAPVPTVSPTEPSTTTPVPSLPATETPAPVTSTP